MFNFRANRLIVTVAAACLAGLWSSHALAQSDAELRRENDRLNARVAELERELEAARARIAELERQMEAMRSGTGAPSVPEEEKRVSIDETKLDASPRSLYNFAVESYEKAMAGEEMGEPNSRERLAYLRTLERWVGRANRELRSQVEWTVDIVNFRTTPKGVEFLLQAVDPKYGSELGSPFPAFMDKTRARAFRTSPTDVYVVKGLAVPAITINPERMEAGAFNNPRLIAPFAEFGFGVEINTMLPAEPVEGDAAGDAANPGTTGGG